ncbi:TonB-dependent receptor domain-containing protein [Mucilaginibacter sp.]|uniref:TonB-dependent receptor n=1 Tax=Mucilaginibacter sp. TaxID=1882438 RepID=UPI003D0D9D58
MKKSLSLFILIIVSSFGLAYSQGSVKGIISDQTGQPLIGATVTLHNKTTQTKQYTSVGLDGSYLFKNLSNGKYTVSAKYISYQTAEQEFEINENALIINLSLKSKDNSLNEVTVAGKTNHTSDKSALNAERNSPIEINSVSARTIEASPDITIANVTQRVSGVSVERSNNGEAQFAIIRGMDQRYEYTLVNGIKLPSPDNKTRYVPLDIFPADIVDRLDISKSLTPDMEGDAIAGAINMVLKQAPDDFTLSANLGTGFANTFFSGNGFTKFDHSASLSESPRKMGNNNANIADFPNNPFHTSQLKAPLGTIAGLTVGGRTADKKFGAIATLSYQNSYRQTNGLFFGSSTSSLTGAPLLGSEQARVYNIQQERTGVVTQFDYRFNANNKIVLNADYINLTRNEYRFTSDTSLSASHTAPGLGTISNNYLSYRTVQQIYNFDLHGTHKLADQWKLDWHAVYSKATANSPDRAELTVGTAGTLNSSGQVVREQPYLPSNPDPEERIFEKNADENKSGYLNLTYSPKLFGTTVNFTAGGMYRDKTRNSAYDEYDLIQNAAVSSAQKFDGNIDNNSLVVQNTDGDASNALNYNFTEKISAAYGMFNFTAGKLSAVGGLRYENTNQSWVSNVNPSTIVGKTGTVTYFDVLPSLNLKYNFNDKQDLRFSYYSAISRPNFYELIPHVVGDPDADYPEYGNPYLKRTTSNNLDLRYEFFPGLLDQFLGGVFYKNIKNPIEYAILQGQAGQTAILEPENFGTATNYGLEIDATKYMRNFGIRLNYTYTNSSISTTKQQINPGNVTLSTVNQTRPLQDQSKNIGNLSFLYREAKIGFDAQISAVYTGPRIYAVSPYLDNDIWQKGFVTLDVSAEKKVFKKFYVYAKATNLTNTPFQLEIRKPYTTQSNVLSYQTVGQNYFIRKDTYEQYYILGLRYKL